MPKIHEKILTVTRHQKVTAQASTTHDTVITHHSSLRWDAVQQTHIIVLRSYRNIGLDINTSSKRGIHKVTKLTTATMSTFSWRIARITTRTHSVTTLWYRSIDSDFIAINYSTWRKFNRRRSATNTHRRTSSRTRATGTLPPWCIARSTRRTS